MCGSGKEEGEFLRTFSFLDFSLLSLFFSSSSFISSFRPIVAFKEIVRGKGVANIFSGIYVSWKTAVSFRRERIDAIFPFIEFCECVYVCVCVLEREFLRFSPSLSLLLCIYTILLVLKKFVKIYFDRFLSV